jgi:hypothetical protein
MLVINSQLKKCGIGVGMEAFILIIKATTRPTTILYYPLLR